MNISIDIPLEYKENLYKLLSGEDFSFGSTKYAFFRAEKNGVIVTFYKSGKLLIQGKESDKIYSLIKEEFVKENKRPWMGTDEAGKGDYFGPLVVAGVIIDPNKKDLFKLGIKDSKRLSSARIAGLAELIKKEFIYEIVILEPKKYNTIYNTENNLNKILSRLHIDVINKLILQKSVNKVVVDKFSRTSGIHEYFKDKVEIDEVIKGEKDLACAAASILARDAFNKYMDKMSAKYKFEFPKGAGKKVKEALFSFLQVYPSKELNNVAKLHFKLTKEVLSD